MSFFSKLRHSLGFADEPDFEIDDTTAHDEADETAAPAEAAAAPGDAGQDYGDAREAIFSHVVAVFNEALPEFLAKSVDPDAQRRLLYEKLDQGMKDYLARIGADADSRCEARWTAEQSNLRTEMDALRSKAEQVERERADLKQRQLSADRQKRALSDRLKDLEAQIASAEAEREQFELENKSLLNKLKVVAVQNPELVDAAAARPEPLHEGPSQEEFDALQAENARLRESIEQAAERQQLADEMTADLRKRLKVALKDVEDLQVITEQVAEVQKAIEDRDATIMRQRDNITRLKGQIDTLTAGAKAAEMRSAERERELMATIEELRAAEPIIEPAPAELQAAAEESVADEPAAPKPRRRKSRRSEPVVDTAAPKITDDDLVDVEAGFADHDWFGVGDPVEIAPAAAPAADDDFGYHAPEPKPRPYDDGMQMSLFD